MGRPKFYNSRSEVPKDAEIIDVFSSGLEELFFVQNPQFKKNRPGYEDKLRNFLNENKIKGIWVYYSKNKKAIHILPEDSYFLLRTARNKQIITSEEQANFRNVKVGVAGLSVGSAIINALVRTGGPKTMSIADFDSLEFTNLNRINSSLLDLGRNKTEIAADWIWELDPFAQLNIYDKGLTKDNLVEFIENPKIEIFIDEMDSIDLKILARFYCRDRKIPVLMATDNGDGVILDVERFDLEPQRPIFHGLVDIKIDQATKLDFGSWLKLATQIVGPEFLSERMQESITEIGKSISAVPQLGSTANIAGAAIGYAVRKIANHQTIPSGRYQISLEEKLTPNYNDSESKEIRKQKTERFRSQFE